MARKTKIIPITKKRILFAKKYPRKLTLLDVAVEGLGRDYVADALGLTYQAIYLWQRRGALPQTEYTGVTNYAEQIEELAAGRIAAVELLDQMNPANKK